MHAHRGSAGSQIPLRYHQVLPHILCDCSESDINSAGAGKYHIQIVKRDHELNLAAQPHISCPVSVGLRHVLSRM